MAVTSTNNYFPALMDYMLCWSHGKKKTRNKLLEYPCKEKIKFKFLLTTSDQYTTTNDLILHWFIHTTNAGNCAHTHKSFSFLNIMLHNVLVFSFTNLYRCQVKCRCVGAGSVT